MLPQLKEFLRKYSGRLLGASVGLTAAVLFLTIGFFRTLLILICVGIGYFIGLFRDSKEEFLEFVERILPKGFK
jgi:uncharacterized membrane protein